MALNETFSGGIWLEKSFVTSCQDSGRLVCDLQQGYKLDFYILWIICNHHKAKVLWVFAMFVWFLGCCLKEPTPKFLDMALFLFTPTWIFSMKSCFFICSLNENANSVSDSMWQKFWKAEIPWLTHNFLLLTSTVHGRERKYLNVFKQLKIFVFTVVFLKQPQA